MKKIKLLTSLSSLAIVGASVPIVATSCSNNNDKTNEYTVSGFNWDKTPTVGVTSTPTMWYITKGDQFIASYDNCENVDDLQVNSATSKDLGFEYNEILQKGFITPTSKGAKTLALDFTLTDGTKFTASTTVVVTSNYPWVVSAGENCTATEEGKRVTIKDVTKKATINVSMDSAPSSAEYIVLTSNSAGEAVELKLENGVLSIPANTFKATNAEEILLTTVNVKNGRSTLGETLFLNITGPIVDYNTNNGVVTFTEWTNKKGTGLLDFAYNSHFPAQGLPNGGLNFSADDGKGIANFINKYVTAGIVAEGVANFIISLLKADKIPAEITDIFEIEDAFISWKTVDRELTLSATFVFLNIEYESSIPINAYGKIIKDEYGGLDEYKLSFIVDGSEFAAGTSTKVPEIMLYADYIMGSENILNIPWDNPYWIVVFSDDEEENNSFYLPIPWSEFKNGKALASMGEVKLLMNGDEEEEFNKIIKDYAANANYSMPSTWSGLTIDATKESKTLVSDISKLLTPTNIEVDKNNIDAGILADGVAQQLATAIETRPALETGWKTLGCTFALEWFWAKDYDGANIIRLNGGLGYNISNGTNTQEQWYSISLVFVIDQKTKAITKTYVQSFLPWDEDTGYEDIEFDISDKDIVSMSRTNPEDETAGYDITLKDNTEGEAKGEHTFVLHIPYTDYGNKLVVNVDKE